MIFGLNFGLQAGEALVSPFNGGMFTNGGFEDGIAGWSNFSGSGWTATPNEDTAQNIPNTAGNHFYQNFTLIADELYQISGDQLSGDGTVTYCINTADSGIPIADGPHYFRGVSTEESIGVTMSIAGTTPAAIDSMRLLHIPNPNMDLVAIPDPLLIEYIPT